MTDYKKKDLQYFFPAFIIWIILLMVTSFQNLMRPNYTMKSPMIVLGGLIFIVGLVIRVVALLNLRLNYSSTLRIREGHQLITHGIYKYVRHPVYTGTLLSCLGLPIFGTSPLGFLFVLMGIPLFIYRIGAEEKMLIEKFGEDYVEYTKATWKLFPYVY